ncbi:zinc finger protein 276 [Periophthalmus magnuspinnatus]|uniref:zinc finger protein 276 n=1 Tax=Periophthalmus magnuspinnatus TaxID=409849 RepID=UPI00145C0D5F|nr:zinc finger protein 276 [Periophthalmus magnuspinnatus]
MKKRSRQKRSREATKQVYRSRSPASDSEDQNFRAPVPETLGRMPSALCRLCHGKFSSRSLRNAFSSSSRDHVDCEEERSVVFHSDFQRLVGVKLNQDPRLSKFICKTCHSKFYKCHGILLRFLQRVNLPPMGEEKRRKSKKSVEPLEQREMPWCFTSDHQCLHSLVSWAHHHAGACSSCPALMDVLESQCRGSVRALWGCGDGHSYEMDTYFSCPEPEQEGDGDTTEESPLNQEDHVESSEPNNCSNKEADADLSEPEEAPLFSFPQSEEAEEEELCDRMVMGGEAEESTLGPDDELFKPYSNKRVSRKKKQSQDSTDEPPVRNKPGPKPGWKNKFKIKGEELPSMFKCPYLGCTAVYRGPDGLKKHIREHHEEVKERPCPHPGCNKVFMIDRYLQRHIKLIHTEERNYICDECGQTFKQRKHLSVHQMRHSGAKPLQCEVCGFQCRQRASLKYHMTKHKAEAELEFACVICEKRFEKAHNLNVHMSMVHPLTQPEPRGPQQSPYSDLQTITQSREVVPHRQDR